MNDQVPDDPNIPRLDGIRNDAGENLFADSEEGDAPEHRESLLASPVSSEPTSIPREAYVQNQQSRGWTVLLVALVSLCGPFGLVEYANPLLPMGLRALGFAFGLPALIMSYGDLRAMNAGVMDRKGYTRTIIALMLGTVGLASALIGLGWFVAAIFTDF